MNPKTGKMSPEVARLMFNLFPDAYEKWGKKSIQDLLNGCYTAESVKGKVYPPLIPQKKKPEDTMDVDGLPPKKSLYPGWFKITKKGTAFRIEGDKFGDPFLQSLYFEWSKKFGMNTPFISPCVRVEAPISLLSLTSVTEEERKTVNLELAMGWNVVCAVNKPLLLVILQGPTKFTYEDSKANTSEWAIPISTVTLYRYYHVLCLCLCDHLIMTSYDEKQKEAKQFINDVLKKKQDLMDKIDEQRTKILEKAIEKIFGNKNYLISFEEQKSKTTTEWVKTHRNVLQDLTEKLRFLTISSFNIWESFFLHLLKPPEDKSYRQMLSTIQSPLSEEFFNSDKFKDTR